MAGVPGQRTGGANKLSAAEHRARGTWRADRHAAAPAARAATAAALPRTPKGLSAPRRLSGDGSTPNTTSHRRRRRSCWRARFARVT
jgi:hypothetical protein